LIEDSEALARQESFVIQKQRFSLAKDHPARERAVLATFSVDRIDDDVQKQLSILERLAPV
jgi:hypothetical protein